MKKKDLLLHFVIENGREFPVYKCSVNGTEYIPEYGEYCIECFEETNQTLFEEDSFWDYWIYLNMVEIFTRDKTTITVKPKKEGSNQIQLSLGREDNFSFVWAAISPDEGNKDEGAVHMSALKRTIP